MKCTLSGSLTPPITSVNTQDYRVGTLFFALYGEKEHIMLRVYDSVVSLTDPEQTFTPPKKMNVIRVLNKEEVVTLQNT